MKRVRPDLVIHQLTDLPFGVDPAMNGVATLEHLVLASAPITGTVLRYGHLYGPDTGTETPGAPPVVLVDAAASAALLAGDKAHAGFYNIAEPSGYDSVGTPTIDASATVCR